MLSLCFHQMRDQFDAVYQATFKSVEVNETVVDNDTLALNLMNTLAAKS